MAVTEKPLRKYRCSVCRIPMLRKQGGKHRNEYRVGVSMVCSGRFVQK